VLNITYNDKKNVSYLTYVLINSDYT